MSKLRFTELLLQEAYKIETVDDYIEAIKANNIGVKIPSFLKDEVNDEEKLESLKSDIDRVMSGLKQYGIKTVQGLQALTSLISPNFSFNEIADKMDYRNDNSDDDGIEALFLIVKYWNAEWMSEKTDDSMSIKDKIANAKDKGRFDINFLANLNDDINDAVYSHGSNAKGSGNWKDVVMLYPRRVYGNKEKINPWETDENGWQLFIPWSFDGERAIAWYGTNPKDMKPTEWCTRARKYFYRTYTRSEDGTETPLYVIRNLKTGKAWQCAIQAEDFDFLNELDKPDSVTKGEELRIIPDALLKEVDDSFINDYGFPMDARSLYDYKVYTETFYDDPEYEDNPKYIKNPFVPRDSHCAVKPILGEPIDFNASDFGIQEGGKRAFNLQIFPILNAVGELANEDYNTLSLHDFFMHDYEYGYDYRSREDDEDVREDYELKPKTYSYGEKGGKFWRVMAEYEGIKYYQDCSLYKGQHTYGGIKLLSNNDTLDMNELPHALYDNMTAIEKTLLGIFKSDSRSKIRTDVSNEVRDAFNNTMLSFLDKKVPKLNNYLKENPLIDKETNKKYYIVFDQKEIFGSINIEAKGSVAKVKDIYYPTYLKVWLVNMEDNQIERCFIEFSRNYRSLPRGEMITDIDTVEAVATTHTRSYIEIPLPEKTKKEIYNFLVEYYGAMKSSVRGWLSLSESIETLFESIYNS